MKYEAVLFDLDGTLLNTADDLADAVNHTLVAWGYGEVSTATVVAGAGNGAAELLAYCLPRGKATPDFDIMLDEYRAWYEAHSRGKTAPYEGISEMLKTLQAQGTKIAILSNKPDGAVKVLCNDFFPSIPAYGEMTGVPRKPAPGMLWKVIDELGTSRDHVAYVGDSEVDAQTCRNADVPLVGVSWGFRGHEKLAQCGVELIADTVEELRNLLS